MKFKFNGGYGAILCEKCGAILKEGNQIPEYVWEAVRNGTVKDLPGMCCTDGCERSKRILGSLDTDDTNNQ